MSQFAERLKVFRKQKKLTQSELAKKVGISTSCIGMYEQGRREPDQKTLIKICSVLEITTDCLLGKSGMDSVEIDDFLDEIKLKMKTGGGLMFNGVPLSEEDTRKLYDAIVIATNVIIGSGEK